MCGAQSGEFVYVGFKPGKGKQVNIVIVIIIIIIIMSIPCRLRQDVWPGLVHNPWEQVTRSHHGSQVSLFLLLTGTILSLVSLLSPTMLFSG